MFLAFLCMNIKLQNDYYFYNEGFHSIFLKNGDTINVNFCNGNFSLYFFIPYHPNFQIQKLIIDGIAVQFYQYRELAIEGKFNATLNFFSNISDLYIQADFWIIHSKLCSNPTIFLYGGYELEFKMSQCNQLCIFSPSFDSKTKNFETEFGAFSLYRDHSSFLYSKSVKTPDIKKYLNEINKYDVNGPFFIQFRSNYSKYNYDDFYYYSRKTELKTKHDFLENFCQMNYILRCNSYGCYDDFYELGTWSCSNPCSGDKNSMNVFFKAVVVYICFIVVVALFVKVIIVDN